MDFTDNWYNPTATVATGARPTQAPQGAAGTAGQGLSGNFNFGVGAGLGTTGFSTMVGAFAILGVAFLLLHKG